MRTLIGLAVVAIAVLLYGVWVARAPSASNPRGDAVVVHAGGGGERLDHALDLMEAGAAPTLVIMRGTAPTWPQANAICGRAEPYEVVCPPPDPDTTIGEALALRDLATARGWTSVVAVSSDYHLRRATYLDAKCAELEVLGSAAASRLSPPSRLFHIVKEMAAMVQSLIVSC